MSSIVSGLDQVTTELQEAIMQTRMQPIGNVFNKFPRVARDLSASLKKEINLSLEGTEVETDKTIIEAIADPLTHLVRNACDHGIETAEQRVACGKPAQGAVTLRAYHKTGKVIIEVIDDGAGIDPQRLKRKAIEKGVMSADVLDQMHEQDLLNLIFAPGFSTAQAVTDVSGRGVGMDVVRTNIEKIGGTVEIESTQGVGSTIRITLPLTLAIIPSMIVSVEGRPYALPQTNIVELVQAGGPDKRIERVSNAEVLRLRGELIPLIRLRNALGLNSVGAVDTDPTDCQLVVVEAGRSRFAVAVDRVLDSEEIVVKPLGRHLKNLPLLAGSTILGDGRVALILDAAGLASRSGISSDGDALRASKRLENQIRPETDLQRFVLFSLNLVDRFAIPMDIVNRIERVRVSEMESVGDRRVLQYRGGALSLLEVGEVLTVGPATESESVNVIVFDACGHEVGLVAPHLDDIRQCDLSGMIGTDGEPGVVCVAAIDQKMIRILDLYGLAEVARPEWFETARSSQPQQKKSLSILVCEDSAFFRNFLTSVLIEEGHRVTAEENGELGWAALRRQQDGFDLLLTDIEMPELDGFGLTKRVRADARLKHLPVIALTSLADADSIERGREAGVNDYQIKMNKPLLLASIQSLVSNQSPAGEVCCK